MVAVARRFPFFGRGKGSLRRVIVAAAAVVLAPAALGLLIWALVIGSATPAGVAGGDGGLWTGWTGRCGRGFRGLTGGIALWFVPACVSWT